MLCVLVSRSACCFAQVLWRTIKRRYGESHDHDARRLRRRVPLTVIGWSAFEWPKSASRLFAFAVRPHRNDTHPKVALEIVYNNTRRQRRRRTRNECARTSVFLVLMIDAIDSNLLGRARRRVCVCLTRLHIRVLLCGRTLIRECQPHFTFVHVGISSMVFGMYRAPYVHMLLDMN